MQYIYVYIWLDSIAVKLHFYSLNHHELATARLCVWHKFKLVCESTYLVSVGHDFTLLLYQAAMVTVPSVYVIIERSLVICDSRRSSRPSRSTLGPCSVQIESKG